jgi:biotin carboxyl carrier protein
VAGDIPSRAQPEPASEAASTRPGGIARRPSDQATIAGLAGDLLPALIARLDASELGELEVRADGWRVRLRRPYDRRRQVVLADSRRRRPHQAHTSGATAGAGGDAAGTTARGAAAAGAGGLADGPGDAQMPRDATSPAVGYFLPRDGMSAGRPVHAGDVLGYVDCLGVRHDVVAPIDGVIGTAIAQPGEAVEYGQALVHVEVVPAPSGSGQVPGFEVAAPPPGTGSGSTAAGAEPAMTVPAALPVPAAPPQVPASSPGVAAAGTGTESPAGGAGAPAHGEASGVRGAGPVPIAEQVIPGASVPADAETPGVDTPGAAGQDAGTPVGSGSSAARHGTA